MAFKRGYKFYSKKRVATPYEFRGRYPRPLSVQDLFYLMQYRAFVQRAINQARINAQRSSVAPKPKQSLPDPHAVLDVPKTASKEEVAEAYRKMAKQYHPDMVMHLGPEKQNEAEQIMKIINEAYDTLKK